MTDTPITPDLDRAEELAPWPVGGSLCTYREYLRELAPFDLAEIDAELDAYFGTEGDASPTEIDLDEHSDTLPEPGR
jgi:hypothetical protein